MGALALLGWKILVLKTIEAKQNLMFRLHVVIDLVIYVLDLF